MVDAADSKSAGGQPLASSSLAPGTNTSFINCRVFFIFTDEVKKQNMFLHYDSFWGNRFPN